MAMITPSTTEPQPLPRKYRSPPHALVWSFRKSRDNWKRKCLDVKAQLRRVRRRLDRLIQANSPSHALPAPSAKTSDAVSPPASLVVLLGGLQELRQQVQANSELLEQSQQQHFMLVDLARQIQQLAARSASSCPPPQAPQPPPTISHQAPTEPKKGAPRQHRPGPHKAN